MAQRYRQLEISPEELGPGRDASFVLKVGEDSWRVMGGR